jgi:hypothetical protein
VAPLAFVSLEVFRRVIRLDLMRSRLKRFPLTQVLPLAGHRAAIVFAIHRFTLSQPFFFPAELCYFL